jgi:hypothetical protein
VRPNRSFIVDILERAAARLDANGWVRLVDGGRNGPNCMRGAIWWTIHEMVEDQRTRVSAERAAHNAVLRLLRTCPGYTITGWNDHECPDGAAAADKLREAAKELAK